MRNRIPGSRSLIDIALVLVATAAVAVALVSYFQGREHERVTKIEAAAHMPAYSLVGKTLPPLDVLAGGRVVSFNLAEGHRPTLLVVFRSACPACELSAPQWKRITDKLPPNARYVFVSTEGDDVARQWTTRHAFKRQDIVSLARPGDIALWGVTAVPLTLLVDAQARVLRAHVGAADPRALEDIGQAFAALNEEK